MATRVLEKNYYILYYKDKCFVIIHLKMKAVKKILVDACCIILAAGEGKRMNSEVPKVLSQVLFKPMLGWVIDAAKKSKIDNICIIKGFKHEIVQSYIDTLPIKCQSVVQEERKGTAHAVMMAKDFLNDHINGDVLILGGDSPFISEEIIRNSYEKHKEEGNSVTIVSAKVDNPFGYGRIIRDSEKNTVIAVVEEKDANDEQRLINEINSGAYWFKIDDLLMNLFNISNETSQNEYYLTSIIELFIGNGLKVNAFDAKSYEVVLGANDVKQLEQLNSIARNKIIDKLVEKGVHIPCRDGVIVGCDCSVDKGVTILPNTLVLGKSEVHSRSIIGPNSQIIDSVINENVIFNSSYCKNYIVPKDENMKPFTYLE